MIIFTPIRNIPIEVLEYKGIDINNIKVYNLSSYHGDIETLNMLIPSAKYMSEESLEGDTSFPSFDIAYHKYILENDMAFIQFMQIILPVFLSPDSFVQILISSSEFRDDITESLLKLIQQRYGYNAYIVNELEDLLYVEESTFSIPGLFAIDQDRYRLNILVPPQGEYYE